jgi:ABC-type lipopolysaccharide export system ATPase subunit
MKPPGTLVASNITRSHGSTPVLVGVSLVVRPRARIGALGPNG